VIFGNINKQKSAANAALFLFIKNHYFSAKVSVPLHLNNLFKQIILYGIQI